MAKSTGQVCQEQPESSESRRSESSESRRSERRQSAFGSESRRPRLHSGGKTKFDDFPCPAQAPSEDVVLLRESIQKLPALDRALVLLYLEGNSYDDISEITGLTRSNVSVRLVRLKQRLRRMLEERGLTKETLQ